MTFMDLTGVKRRFLTLILCALAPLNSLAHQDGLNVADYEVCMTMLESQLLSASDNQVSEINLRNRNQVLLITLANHQRAIFKTAEGESPEVVNYVRHVGESKGVLGHYEVAVSLIARILQMGDRVPLARRGYFRNKPGVMIDYVDGLNFRQIMDRGNWEVANDSILAKHMEVLELQQLFDFLTSNPDRAAGDDFNPSNWMGTLDEDGAIKEIFFIDNGVAFLSPEHIMASSATAAVKAELLQRLQALQESLPAQISPANRQWIERLGAVDEPQWRDFLKNLIAPEALQRFLEMRAYLVARYIPGLSP